MILSELLDWLVPSGDSSVIVVIVGMAFANDVHGKNHHQNGTFGSHIGQLALLRSDGKVYTCSSQDNPSLLFATIRAGTYRSDLLGPSESAGSIIP